MPNLEKLLPTAAEDNCEGRLVRRRSVPFEEGVTEVSPPTAISE